MKTIFLLLLLTLTTTFIAQSRDEKSVGIKVDKFTVVEAPSIFTESNLLNKTATSNINIIDSTQNGMPLEIRYALEYAIELWSFLLNTTSSNQTINSLVNYRDLGGDGTLAQCGPTSFYNHSNLPYSNINYPIALAEDILNQNLNGDDPEISLEINSNETNTWYTGTDGIPHSEQYDLVTTLLHELMHGFGIIGSMRLVDSLGLGYWGYDSVQTNLDGHYPSIYDYYCVIGPYFPANDKLINYQTGSTTLATKLKSNNIFFSGPFTREVYNYSYPKLYAPTTWEPFSSIDHLDEGTFNGSNNALITSQLNYAEVIHSPGVIGLTILKDLGWTVNRLVTIEAPKNGELLTKGHTYTIKWSDNDGTNANMVLYKIEPGDILSYVKIITPISGLGTQKTYDWIIPTSLTDGEYRIKIEGGGTAWEISPKFQLSTTYKVATPIITPVSGEYTSNQEVFINCPTDSAAIYYTTDESTPDTNSTKYTGVFYINPPKTIKAIAVKNGMTQSEISVEIYNLNADEMSVVQKDIDGNKFGHVDLYSTTYSFWVPLLEDKSVRKDYLFFRADTIFKAGTTQKFKQWAEVKSSGEVYNKYTNYSSRYNPSYTTTEIVAQFAEAKNVNLRIGIEQNGGEVSSNYFEMKDPWFRDYNDTYDLRNRGTVPILHPVPSDVTTSTDNKGVFLGQGYNDPTKPYYSVKATSPQLITNVQGKDRNFYFQNWEADPSGNATFQYPNNLETPVVFNSANATVKAVMKGTGLSNNSNTYKTNNQRKIVKTDNGNLHRVYESMGKVWYERSTDNGNNWTLMNNGQPISSDEAKLPSIDYNGNDLFIVFQEKNYSYSEVKFIRFNYISNEIKQNLTVALYQKSFALCDLSPVVKFRANQNDGDFTIVIWDCPEAIPFCYSSAGLYYRIAKMDYSFPNNYNWINNNSLINNTNSNSSKPTITSTIDYYSNIDFHLAWQQSNSSGSKIKYQKMVWDDDLEEMEYYYYSEASSTTGYSDNFDPSIAITLNRPRVVWLTQNPITLIKEGNLRTKNSTGTAWGTLKRFSYGGGDDVESIVVNSRNTSFGYVVAYAGDGNEVRYYKADNTNQAAQPLRYERYVQLSNGDDYNDMAIETFNTTTPPYYFKSTLVDATLSKTSTENDVIKGREIVLTKGKSKIILGINNIILNDETVNFVEVEDTLISKTKAEAIELFETNDFSLTDNSDFGFDLSYVLFGEGKLTNHFDMEIDLVDAKTNKTIGVLDKIETSKMEADKVNETSFKIDTKGIVSKKVKLKLIVDESVADSITISSTYKTGKENLPKENNKLVAYDNTLEITDYALSQNYPNPFNPSTIINYQIPKDGYVTLKIYDITGREITTLVNSLQTKGRYKVNFDASNLSSGVYFYSLRSGSYMKTMKMILIR